MSVYVSGSFHSVMETYVDRPVGVSYRGRHRRYDPANTVLVALSAATAMASGLTLIGSAATSPAPDAEPTVLREASNLFPTTVAPPAHNAVMERPAWTAPSKAELSDTYGPRDWRNGEMHYGIDFAADQGVVNVAAHSGTVTFAGTRSGYGKLVTIDDGDGVESWYGHHSKLAVSKGDKVRTGDPIGLAGDTGDATGPHLHFEIRIDDRPVDPLPFFSRHGIDP